MGIMYSVSDIHGDYEALIDVMSLIDLNGDKNNKLLFLGDYISRGKDSCKVLYYIKSLEEMYPNQVIVLIGNHEQMFLNWYFNENEFMWLSNDRKLLTIKSFSRTKEWSYFLESLLRLKHFTPTMSDLIKGEIGKEHTELIKWLFSKRKKYFYETENQIYVHAGVCEDDSEIWKETTNPRTFTWKYPAETGIFYKDIIAGHISTVEVSKNNSYLGKVFWDGQSHFFIDGETEKSGIVPLLKYDTCTGVYSSYEKDVNKSWIQYHITKKNV